MTMRRTCATALVANELRLRGGKDTLRRSDTRKNLAYLLAAFLILSMPETATSAESVAGRKVAVSADSILLPSGGAFSPLLTAEIKKGKRRHVLIVEATIARTTSNPGTLILARVDVNGVAMEPSPLSVGQECPAICIVSGSWWLDLDAHQELIGVPLTVTLSGIANPAVIAEASLVARLERP